MEMNYEIQDIIAVKFNGIYCDLHNNYDLSNFVRTDAERTCSLQFEKRTDDWVDQDSPDSLKLDFLEVNFIELNSENETLSVDLDEIGFKKPGDNDMDWLMNIQGERVNAHIVFRFGFENVTHIRIGAKSSRCTLG